MSLGRLKGFPGLLGPAAFAALLISFGGVLMWPVVRSVVSGYSTVAAAEANGVYPIVLLMLASPFFGKGRAVEPGEKEYLVRAAGVAGLIWSAGAARVLAAQPSLGFIALCAAAFSGAVVLYPQVSANAKAFVAFLGLSLVTALPSVYLVTPLSEAYASLVTRIASLMGVNVSGLGQLIVINGHAGTAIAYVEDGCTGIAAAAIFLALFALLLRQSGKTWRETMPLAIVGVGGLQAVNLLRMLLTIEVGNSGGWLQMDKYHVVAGYLLFVLFYAVFVLAFLAKYDRSFTRSHQAIVRLLALFAFSLVLLSVVGTAVAASDATVYSNSGCTAPVTTAGETQVYAGDTGALTGGAKYTTGNWSGSIVYVNPAGGTVATAIAGSTTSTKVPTALTVNWAFCDGIGVSANTPGVWKVTVFNTVVFATRTVTSKATDNASTSFTITATPDFGLGGVPLLLLGALAVAGLTLKRRSA
ncbi:MAG: exosortase/archaeosortase family protein [Nitrososphaerota archaeon]|nr:exosortase/archaeosortase family protein [Nitrososphaerota archaeon]